MTGFRLVEYGGGGRGPVTFPRIYDTVLDAVEAAEIMLAALADHPHRRPFRVDVYDVWTRETVSSVRLDVPRNPDVCPACGAPSDPFAGGVEQGSARPPSGATSPPHPARGHVGTEATDNASSLKRVDSGPSPLPDASEWQIRPARRPGTSE